jgi:predicted amidophosphoribosyltransferase
VLVQGGDRGRRLGEDGVVDPHAGGGLPGLRRGRARPDDDAAAEWKTMKMIVRCQVCGAALGRRPGCPNYWCTRDDRGWDVVWSVGEHRGSLQRAIAALKYGGQRRWLAPLADLLSAYLLEHLPVFEDVDVLVPVPSNVGSRRREDHVALVLGAAAGAIGELWEVRSALAKHQETLPLAAAPSALVRRLRAAGEVRPALVVTDPAAVRGRRVLAVDDVFTDGSTLREVAIALRRAGAVAVSGLVLARRPLRISAQSPW